MSDLIWDQWGIEEYLKSCIRSVDGKEKIDFVLMQKRFFFSQKIYNFVVWNLWNDLWCTKLHHRLRNASVVYFCSLEWHRGIDFLGGLANGIVQCIIGLHQLMFLFSNIESLSQCFRVHVRPCNGANKI